MKKITKLTRRSQKAMLRGVLRWSLYAAVLLVFYLFETNPLIRGFCPLLIIPLASAVAMREGDLAAGVFGAFCGLMLDMANGVAVVGFSALWLLCLCPPISLLLRFWVKVNMLSHFVMNFTASVFMAAVDFLFLHVVWEGAQSSISFVNVILPAYLGAIISAPAVYLLVYFINRKVRPKEERRLEESAQNAGEAEAAKKE